MDRATFAERYDAVLAAPRTSALFGDSGYFNVGYWDRGVTDLEEACDRMVDELAAAVPAGARVILDVGCGRGSGTRRLGTRFPDALVMGANISLRQLLEARGRGVGAVAVMDAARLAVASGCVDALLAVESPQHFDTRAEFLAEAHRVLRPGGAIALADMLLTDREPFGEWMLPPENAVDSPERYRDLLAESGFGAIEVRDVTELCWRPFCAAMRELYSGHEDAADAIERSVSHYVIAFARRPPA